MTLTEGLDAVLATMIETERRVARRTGEHIDRINRTLAEESAPPAPLPMLPPAAFPIATRDELLALKKGELNALLRAMKVPGRTKAIKTKGKDAVVALLMEHNAQALTFERLLNFYFSATGQA